MLLEEDTRLMCMSLLNKLPTRAICHADGPHGTMRSMNAYSEDLRRKNRRSPRTGRYQESEAARAFSR
jgi:hypothetical protein